MLNRCKDCFYIYYEDNETTLCLAKNITITKPHKYLYCSLYCDDPFDIIGEFINEI